jgi:hypothetical protein
MSQHRPSLHADYIRVHRDGTIESCLTRGRNGGKTANWKPLKVQLPRNKDRYPTVSLKVNGKFKPVQVHKIVAYAWHGAPQPGQLCRHLDDNKLNWHADNLAWGTAQDNADDAKRNGIVCGRPAKPKPEPLSEAMRAYYAIRPGRGRKPKSLSQAS